MPDLVLPLKSEYFYAIRDGSKRKEYRLANEYWARRLEGRTFDRVVLTRGYPKAGDKDRRLVRRWTGFERETITHPHFGDDPVEVFAIDVSKAIDEAAEARVVSWLLKSQKRDLDRDGSYGHRSSREIGLLLGMSRTAVRPMLKDMERRGLIKGVTYVNYVGWRSINPLPWEKQA